MELKNQSQQNVVAELTSRARVFSGIPTPTPAISEGQKFNSLLSPDGARGCGELTHDSELHGVFEGGSRHLRVDRAAGDLHAVVGPLRAEPDHAARHRREVLLASLREGGGRF